MTVKRETAVALIDQFIAGLLHKAGLQATITPTETDRTIVVKLPSR